MRVLVSWLTFAGLALAAGMLVSCGSGSEAPRKVSADPRPTRIGTIESKRIKESSGIIASRRYPGVFWTHNDQGNAPFIYAITREGKSLAEYRLATDNDDWEDIAADDQGRLYVASTGNNDGKRKEVEVLRIEEPDPGQAHKDKTPRIKKVKTWKLTYPDKPFDSEALFVYQGFGYLISKVNRDRPATMYSFPLTEDAETVALQKVTDLPIYNPVTAADLSPDGANLAVLSWGNVHVFRVNRNLTDLPNIQPVRIPLPRLQLEGCCFAEGGVVLTAESREILFVPAGAYMGDPASHGGLAASQQLR